MLVLTGPLLNLMERRQAARVEGCPWVFHRPFRGHPHKIVSIKRPWDAARIAAGVPDLWLHDFRRSAIRNMDKAGVSQSVAMSISGHKTASVYQRYWIIDEGDIERALSLTQDATRPASAVQAANPTNEAL